MIRLIFTALLLSLGGCGLVGEKEPPAPIATADRPGAHCTIPDWETLTDEMTVTEALWAQAIDCVDRQIHDGFTHLKSARPNEISYPELRRLVESRIIDLPLHSEARWTVLRLLLPLVGPEGRAAVTRAKFETGIAWMRRNLVRITRFIRESRADTSKRWLLEPETLTAYDEFIDLISPQFHLTRADAHELVDATAQIELEKRKSPIDLKARHDYAEAYWTLKALVFPDPSFQGPRADLWGRELISLCHLAVRSAREAPLTRDWAWNRLRPSFLPAALDREWEHLAALWAEYFGNQSFAAIEAPQLQSALSFSLEDQNLPLLSPDLARLSERLSPQRQQRGVHASSFLAWLSEAGELARDLMAGAKAFPKHRDLTDPWLPIRQALKDPWLAKVALKGPFPSLYWPESGKQISGVLDLPLSWNDAAGRFAMRAVVSRIFAAFAPEDGKLPLAGETEEDVRKTLDLAFTLLRFISTQVASQNAEASLTKAQTPVPNVIMVKPGALSKVMGLLGDEWMPDGNRDGSLEADEFFSVVQVYQDMNDTANRVVWQTEAKKYVSPGDFPRRYASNVPSFYDRLAFIRALPASLLAAQPVIGHFLDGIPRAQVEELFHALVSNGRRRPIDVVSADYGKPATLRQYVGSDAAFAPVALLSALNRLMILCDRSPEDGRLDWKELDCAVPLILEAGYHTVASELLSLDPGVHDGALLLTGFLQHPGVPLSAAKLLVINGSVSSLRPDLTEALQQWLDTEMSLDFDEIASFLQAKSRMPYFLCRIEARRRFGACDFDPRDGRLHGKKELDCFADRVVETALATPSRWLGTKVGLGDHSDFQKVIHSPLLFTGIKLAMLDENRLKGMLARLPLKATPASILSLLEEIIKRSELLPEKQP